MCVRGITPVAAVQRPGRGFRRRGTCRYAVCRIPSRHRERRLTPTNDGGFHGCLNFIGVYSSNYRVWSTTLIIRRLGLVADAKVAPVKCLWVLAAVGDVLLALVKRECARGGWTAWLPAALVFSEAQDARSGSKIRGQVESRD